MENDCVAFYENPEYKYGFCLKDFDTNNINYEKRKITCYWCTCKDKLERSKQDIKNCKFYKLK